MMDAESSTFEHNTIEVSFEEIQELACVGATSVSYKVRLWGKWFFLKRPKPEYADNPKYIAAFEKEFDLGIHLDHPYIVRYDSKGYDAQGAYILTEYVDGVTLTEYVKAHPKLSKYEVRRIIGQIADALRYLHARQIVHFDLKPDNILITANGQNVKLVDLGFAYSDCYSAIACGSPAYSAPEQFAKPDAADLRADIFALGNVIKFITPTFPKVVRRATRLNPDERYPDIDVLLWDMKPKRWLGYAIGLGVVVLCGIFIGEYSTLSYQEPVSVSQRDTIVQIQYVDKRTDSRYETNQDSIIAQKLRKDIQKALQPVASTFFREHPVITKENEQEVKTAFIGCRQCLDSLASQLYSCYNPENLRERHWLWRICEDEVRNALLPFKKISEDFTSHEVFINQYKTVLHRGYESIFDSVYYSSVSIGSIRDKRAYKQASDLKEKAQQIALVFQDSVICEYLQIAPSDSARFYSEATAQMCIALEYHDRIIDHYKKHYQD